jgi:acetylornithine deacetylase/succinyl-diaminopimelate desuccinylase-like protein
MRRTAVWCRFASVAPPIVALVTAALVGGCARPREFAGARAYADVVAQCQLGPRLPGSEASAEAREYFARELRHAGWNVQEQTLVYRDVPLCNVIASKGSGPLVIVGAHYDSRATADRDQRRDTPVPGANDGASGAAVLLELARSLDAKVLQNEVWLAFFDAEDQGQIDGWPWSVGAEYLAGGLDIPPEFVIIVDMVGDADQQLLGAILHPGAQRAGLDDRCRAGIRSVLPADVQAPHPGRPRAFPAAGHPRTGHHRFRLPLLAYPRGHDRQGQ